jgi:hypothetical protein
MFWDHNIKYGILMMEYIKLALILKLFNNKWVE